MMGFQLGDEAAGFLAENFLASSKKFSIRIDRNGALGAIRT